MSKSPQPTPGLSDKQWLMREASKITSALGEMFAPLCEVVLHDLTDPEHAIIQIENNLSGRSIGDSATELGLARIVDPDFPEVLANYANSFSDGRPAKSTSIGLKDKSGRYVAAICLNLDISYLRSISTYFDELTRIKLASPTSGGLGIEEHLTRRLTMPDVSTQILAYSAARNRDPRSLSSDEKSELLKQLVNDGALERRGAAETIASMIGVSRSNVYYYINRAKREVSASREGSSQS